MINFFSLTRNRAAPKNAGYAFLSFRNRAMMERFAECIRGLRISHSVRKPINVRLGSLRNLAEAKVFFDGSSEQKTNPDILWANQVEDYSINVRYFIDLNS